MASTSQTQTQTQTQTETETETETQIETQTPPPGEQTCNWLELPPEVMSSILHRVGAIDILMNAQKVCTTWWRLCKDPAMWRVINMHTLGDVWEWDYDIEKMCMYAIDLSHGQLVDINIEYFGSNELLRYISHRSSQLRRLRLVSRYERVIEVFSEVVKKLPLLEELHLNLNLIEKEAIEAVGHCCPLLKSFKLNKQGSRRPHIEDDEEALAIAESMPELRHLQLLGNKMTNRGLQAILDGCPHLEFLDLRQCFNISLAGNLATRCSEQIKDLRQPNDSTEDYEFDAEIHDYYEYASGSDIDTFSFDDGYYTEFSVASYISSDSDDFYIDDY